MSTPKSGPLVTSPPGHTPSPHHRLYPVNHHLTPNFTASTALASKSQSPCGYVCDSVETDRHSGEIAVNLVENWGKEILQKIVEIFRCKQALKLQYSTLDCVSKFYFKCIFCCILWRALWKSVTSYIISLITFLVIIRSQPNFQKSVDYNCFSKNKLSYIQITLGIRFLSI